MKVPTWVRALQGLPDDYTPGDAVPRHGARAATRGSTPPEQPAAAPPPSGPAAGVTPAGYVLTPPRAGESKLVRRTVTAVLLLLLYAGLNQVVSKPAAHLFAGDAKAATTGTAAVDPAAARQLAVGYSADYWSYDAADPLVRAEALARWAGTDPDQARAGDGWTGTGQLHPDLVTAGAVTPAGADQLVVATTARVTPAALPDGATLPSGGTQYPTVRAADPGPARQPWVAGAARWLSLAVVVTRTATGLHVTDAVLTGDPPAALPSPGSQVDTATTAATAELPTDVFTAYAAGKSGQLGYLTAPHVTLAGLAGVAELAQLSDWSVAQPPAADGTRYATATVTWRLAGTDLTVAQPYALHLQYRDQRWLVAALGPELED